MFTSKTNEYLKEIEENHPKFSIEHDKKISENYLKELEKYNTVEEQEFYNKEKKFIESELKGFKFHQGIDLNPIIPLLLKKIEYDNFLKENTELFFNELNLNVTYQKDLNKQFESFPKYPTIKNKDKIFILYKKENSNEFFESLENQNEILGWKKLIQSREDLNIPGPHLFLNLNRNDFDEPYIFSENNKVKFIFNFPLYNEDEKYKFKMIFKTIYTLTIDKYKIDKTKEISYYWDIDGDIKNGLFYLIFDIKM
jgi:hypothetical protein